MFLNFYRYLQLFLLLVLFFNSAELSSQTLPTPPQLFVDTSYNLPSGGRRWDVKAGDNLQQVIIDAAKGDVIVLEAGAVFVGPIKLPAKPGQGWIYIISSELDKLPLGKRVSLNDVVNMPNIVTPSNNANGYPALFTVFDANHYRLAGIEFSTTGNSYNTYNLVLMGWGITDLSHALWRKIQATSVDQLPHHIIYDRCIFRSSSDDEFARRGLMAEGRYIGVVDSYFSNFKDRADSQAIMAYNSPGPYKIVNNFLEASGENIMFGGSDPAIADMIPADIEIRRNHFFKRDSWWSQDPYASQWCVKNHFELKNAQRVLFDGNLLENNYGLCGGQRARSIVLTPRNQDGGSPWSLVRDVTITNNIIRRVGNGAVILSEDNIHSSQLTARILIRNNVFDEIIKEYYANNGGFSVTGGGVGTADLVIRNNLVLHGGASNNFLFLGDNRYTVESLWFENNIVTHGDYGTFGSGQGLGVRALDFYASSYSFKKNLIIMRSFDREANISQDAFERAYTADNTLVRDLGQVGFTDYDRKNYRLLAGSSYKGAGTDGKDLGPDYDELERAMNLDLSGKPSPPKSLRVLGE